jgi:GNAT superfamily N-acetyltransferase
MQIVEIATADTYPLRLAVLRSDTPTRDVSFAEDDLPGVVHLGVRDGAGLLIATSTWVPRDNDHFPERRGVQLRGMATATGLQGTGVGGALLEAGTRRHADAGFELMWAKARDAALAFYLRHGCAVVGDGFIDETTQLPHHIVVRYLASSSP